MDRSKKALALGVGFNLAIGLGEIVHQTGHETPRPPIETSVGSVAMSHTKVEPPTTLPIEIEPTTTTTAPPVIEPIGMPADQYNEDHIVPNLESAGLQIVEPIHENVETVNYPGEFIVTKDGSYGVQFYVGPSNDHRDPVQTMNISVTVFGNLTTLRDGRVEGSAIHENNEDFHHAEGILASGCNFDPAKPEEAALFVTNTEAELTRAVSTGTAINIQELIQGLPVVSFLGNFSDVIG